MNLFCLIKYHAMHVEPTFQLTHILNNACTKCFMFVIFALKSLLLVAIAKSINLSCDCLLICAIIFITSGYINYNKLREVDCTTSRPRCACTCNKHNLKCNYIFAWL